MIKDKNMCAIYTSLWMIYSSQQVLQLEASAKVILPILIAFSLYKMCYVAIHYKFPPLLKAYSWLLASFIIYGISHLLFGHVRVMILGFSTPVKIPQFYYLKDIFAGMLPVYVYYDYASKGVFTYKNLFRYLVAFLFFDILNFLHYYTTVERLVGELTNNAAYLFIPILVLLFYIKRYRILFVLICYGFIICGLKRGAIIIGSILFILHLIIIYKDASSNKKILALLGIALLLSGTIYEINNFYQNNSYSQSRFEQTKKFNSSGRDEIFTKLWDTYVDEPKFVYTLFGKGADATIDIAGNYAHNDWLEIITNQGAVGVFIYLFFYWIWFRSWISMKRNHFKYANVMGALLLAMFLKSLFSMSYLSFRNETAICLSLTMVLYKKYKNNENTLIY